MYTESKTLFRRVEVWEKQEPEIVAVYRIWENLETGRFVVQSCDFIDRAKGMKEQVNFFENQLADLFSEECSDERNESHSTLTEAIEAHKLEFFK